MGTLAAALLGCGGHSLFRVYELRLFPGLVSRIRLALVSTCLSSSYGWKSPPAPAEQVVHLRWMCATYHRSRHNRAAARLSISLAKWLVLSARRQWTRINRPVVHLSDLQWHWRSALPAL